MLENNKRDYRTGESGNQIKTNSSKWQSLVKKFNRGPKMGLTPKNGDKTQFTGERNSPMHQGSTRFV